MYSNTAPTVLSLFSSAGIGELGLKSAGLNILLSNELLKERSDLYHQNYPETENLCGDIWNLKDEIIKKWKDKKIGSPFLLYATPPCQGMSFNSVGAIQNFIREGVRPKEDPRNRLIIPTVEIIKSLRPLWVLMENVPEMNNTIIRTDKDEYKNIIQYIKDELTPEYVGKAEVVNCANFGIPQIRERLITIFTRSDIGKKHFSRYNTFIPITTHSQGKEEGKDKWVSLREAIGNLPELAGKKGENQSRDIPWHIVPIMKDEKFWWVSNTPYNETAYNNQCVECGYKENPRHGMCMLDGRHQSKKNTPIYCANCGSLLPRPTMIDKKTGKRRLIKGFDSAYRRMVWDNPAGTITQNFQYEASDKKIHPVQNRTLSVYEAMVLQSISEFEYVFAIKGKQISRNLCCQIIGESVPPRLIKIISSNILKIERSSL